MNSVLRYIIVFSASLVFAISDKVAIVVNDHIITERELSDSVMNFAKVSGNMNFIEDAKFKSYVASLLVSFDLVSEFAQRNNIDLTDEESSSAIDGFLKMQGKSEGEFEQIAADIGIPAKWLKYFILSNARQQKVGGYVVAPNVSVTQEDVDDAKHAYLSDNTEYQLKSWVVDKNEPGMSVAAVKAIKVNWAATARDPIVGEVQDLGWKKRGELPEIFLKALSGVQPGNLVGPIQSEYGYHLVWFERERSPEAPDDNAIFQSLFQEKYMVKLNEWLDELPQYNVVIYK